MSHKYKKKNWIVYYNKFAPFYDRFYDDYKDDIDFYSKLATSTDANILEVGCGTGRVLIPLSKKFKNVTGLDNSPKMIEICNEKMKRMKLKSKPKIIHADMCNFHSENLFDLIIVSFHSFCHLMNLDDQVRALKNFKKHLAQEGTLVIDLFNPDIKTMYEWNHKTLRLEEADYIDPDSKCKIQVSQRFDYDYLNQFIIWTNYFERVKKGKVVNSQTMKGGLHYFWKSEFELLLKYVNFDSWQVYGGYNREELNEDSEEMIWVIK